MENNEGKTCSIKGCKCTCHMILGILIALIGVVFLLSNYDIVSAKAVANAWPILLIGIGLNMMCPKGMCKWCSSANK